MLHAEADRRQRVLDFVRHLARHLAPRQHARGPRERGGVVQRDDAAVRRRPERRNLHADLSPPHVELALRDALSLAPCARTGGEELAHRVPYGEPLGRRRPGEQVAGLELCPEQVRRAGIGHRHAQLLVHGDHAGRDVREHLGRPVARLLQRRLALVHVRRHALERRHDRLELAQRPGRKRGQRRALAQRDRGIPQRGHRAGEAARHHAGERDRGDQTDQNGEDQGERQILERLADALVVHQLRRGENRLRPRRAGHHHPIPHPHRSSGGAPVGADFQLVTQGQPHEHVRSEERIRQPELIEHRCAGRGQHAVLIQPEVGIEPVSELADRAIDVGRPVRHGGARRGGGVAQGLTDEQVAVLAGIVTELRKAPQCERHHRHHEKAGQCGGEPHPVTGAERRENGRQPRSPPVDE